MKKASHSHHGTVTGITPHGDHHIEVEVSHGRKKPLTKTQKKEQEKYGTMSGSMYDSRPRSRVVLPKEHADKYHLGQRVGAGLAALDDDDDTENDSDLDDAMDDYRATQRGITSFGNRPKKRR